MAAQLPIEVSSAGSASWFLSFAPFENMIKFFKELGSEGIFKRKGKKQRLIEIISFTFHKVTAS